MAKIKVAITGGIGSGKSTVLAHLQNMGYPVFSCDEIYKQIITTESYIKAIKKRFPSVLINGNVDKKLLADIVFEDEKALSDLNSIAHPLIMKELLQSMENCKQELVFAEVPLLFECEFETLFDKVIVVKRNETDRITSVQQRDNVSIDEVQKRINAQFDYFSKEGELRIKKCGAVILENNALSKMKEHLEKIIIECRR